MQYGLRALREIKVSPFFERVGHFVPYPFKKRGLYF
jgi:hypothetical protein